MTAWTKAVVANVETSGAYRVHEKTTKEANTAEESSSEILLKAK